MQRVFLKYISKSILCALFLAMPVCAYAGSGVSDKEPRGRWCSIEKGNLRVVYASDIDPRSLNRRIRIDFIRPSGFLRKPAIVKLGDEDALMTRIEYIFGKVESILGMYPRDIKLEIKIFKTKEELNSFYFSTFKRADSVTAFHVQKFNTIYMHERGVTQNVLAHELAHCVIDNYFKVIPPQNTAEIIAQHVDLHLED